MALLHKHHLADIHILIADSDHQMATVLSHTLKHMGFREVHTVRNGDEAIRTLNKQPIDIVITDWQMPHTDGMELTRHVRRSDDSPNRSLPMIMLTARAERNDVEAARDAGITEFVVKPYNSKTLFNRIEQVVDNPRGFVLSNDFIGPNRRRKAEEGGAAPDNRRTIKPRTITNIAGISDYSTPKMLPPDFGLKRRIGINITDSISTIITSAVLDEAQKAIDMLKDESLGWIKDDIKAMETVYDQLVLNPDNEKVEVMKNLLLSIKSRAGTFGYKNASDAAQILYRFVRNDFVPENTQHTMVLLKNIQALKILLASSMSEKNDSVGQILLKELQAMADKFQQGG